MLKDFKFSTHHEGMSIVLRGTFNPLLYHPTWFVKKEVLSEEEVSAILNNPNANLVMTPGFTFFKASNFEFNITPDRFTITAGKAPFIVLKDSILRSFENLGSLTIRTFGINRFIHIELPDSHSLQMFADRIAPKDIWTSLLGDEVSGDDRKSGLLKMTMTKMLEDGAINFQIEKSPLLKYGILVHCNRHYVLKDDLSFADEAMSVISTEFDNSIVKSDEIIYEIFKGI